MGKRRVIILVFGTLAMFLLMLFRKKEYPQIKIWKMVIISILLTISGVLGAMLMHRIENGSFGGTSFFGAVLFIPFIISPAVLLKIRYSTLLDLCAPCEALMLAFMKFDCILSGCCIGKYLPSLEFQFPSRTIEIIVTLIITVALVKIENKNDNKGLIYAWYLILYGFSRFWLNWFRYGVKPVIWIFPYGNVWSIVAVVSGIVWIAVAKKYRLTKK